MGQMGKAPSLFPPNPPKYPFDSPSHHFKTIGIPNAIITVTVTVSFFVLILLIILALAAIDIAIAFEDPQIGLLLVDPNHLSQVSTFYPTFCR
ncbi:hypothetical protein L1987_44913 [Smallanthus sonchifolius]|uniref:Uncharacterized protein n=1 Tax=Smallanthus sonchifolius TaxID=185202 RepID=A0ACB9GRJ0_9ASTR|nr:hypothetical protein L1987_44913 [Smallanthus sonchifolius]